MLYTHDDLEVAFDANTLDRATVCLDLDQVALPDIRQNGRLITSLVNAEGRRPLRVYIRIEREQGSGLQIHGECSCSARGACEHVAAVLMRALEESEGRQAGTPELVLKREPVSEQPKAKQERYPAGVNQRLLYLLWPSATPGTSLALRTMSGRLRSVGGFGHLSDYQPEWASLGRAPRFLLESDLWLLSTLEKLPQDPWSVGLELQGATGQQLLISMIETGRCYLEEPKTPLRLGGTRPLSFSWSLDAAGIQHPTFDAEDSTKAYFLLGDAWYLDPEDHSCGQLQTDYPRPLLEALFKLSAGVAPEEVEEVSANLRALSQGIELPALKKLRLETVSGIKPIPCLELFAEEDGVGSEERFDQARLSFEYRGRRFGKETQAQWLEGGRVTRVERDWAAEQAALQRLLDAGFEWVEEMFAEPDSLTLYEGPEAWFDFQTVLLPQLRDEGWKIEFEENFGLRLLDVEGWYGELTPKTEKDWFQVGLGVEVEGERINLLQPLVALLHNYPETFNPKQLRNMDPAQMLVLTLEDGRLLPLALGRVRQILDTLFELYEEKSLDKQGQLALSRIQLARLAEFEEMESSISLNAPLGVDLASLRDRLRNSGELPLVATPQGLRAKLRDYQHQGLSWLQFLRQSELAGVLADDMGLGKTVQTLAHLLLEKEQGRMDRPCLVVAPTSLMVNWRREAAQFAPRLRVLVLHGSQRHKGFGKIADHDLVITSYPLLSRDQQVLMEQAFHLLILDEAQAIKNPKTKASRVVRQLDARHRLCLTGTPLENHLGELWSLFDFLLPGLLGSERQFRKIMRNPIEKQGDEAAAERLAQRVRPFMLRRTKQEVVKELPPKTEILRSVELSGGQRELYETIRLAMQEQVRQAVMDKGWERSRIVVLDALLKLRQVCCDPRLVKLSDARRVKGSAKLELLMELLPEMIEEGRRVLLFSQFTSMLALIEEALKKQGIDYVKLTGRTKDRAAPVDQFQSGKVPLFLISLKAGGTGLNLTAADTVIHYDPWWNPAVERQATDRAHRIGQENPVFVYKLISEGTVEERIQEMQVHKQALADNLFAQAGKGGPGWSEEDLESLFSPLE
jgi:superfamily II DNA or RNA helicase